MTEYHHSDRAGDAGATLRRWAESDHAEIGRAREAAEALFARKRQVIEPSAPATVPSADPTARKPRILSAVPAQPIHVEATKPVAPAKPHQKIPASQFGRIRTWLKYGMTIAQVAELYGATVGDVESILKGSLTVTG